MYATKAALEQARRLLPRDAVLEVAVAERIMAGGFVGGQKGGRVFGDGWFAVIERVPGRFRPRPRAWLVVRLERSVRSR